VSGQFLVQVGCLSLSVLSKINLPRRPAHIVVGSVGRDRHAPRLAEGRFIGGFIARTSIGGMMEKTSSENRPIYPWVIDPPRIFAQEIRHLPRKRNEAGR
jgi:hypothetical protein